jgi:TolB protein
MMCLLAAIGLVTAGPEAGLHGQRFLVTSVRTGDTEVFLVDPITGDATNLTRSPGSEDRYPCWSPDGTRFAFTSDRDGTSNLYVAEIDGAEVKRITNLKAPGVAYMPSWVCDRIVFGLHDARSQIAIVKPDGGDMRILGPGHDPVLSPDGNRIAFTGEAPGGVTVFVMDADGARRRQLVKEANPWGAIFPDWSPDGKWLVYAFKVGEGLELFVIDAEGQTVPRQLTHLRGISTPAAWSPDGSWISFRHSDEAYWRDPERMKQIYRERPGNKRPVWVIRSDGTEAHIVECLRYQCAMDGSRAAWRPRPRRAS